MRPDFLRVLVLASVALTPSLLHAAETVQDKIAARRHQQAGGSEVQNRIPQRQPTSTLRQFIGKDGRVVFTNRPEKYQGKNYKEVIPKLERISVPARYRHVTNPTAYAPADLAELIRRYARLYGLEESLVYAVIKAESNFNPQAVSPAGARGLMQLMPGTALEMGVTDIFDPAQNIAGGTQYLAKMLSIFNGDLRLALAAYNAGPQTVVDYKGIPPYDETQTYVEKVIQFKRHYERGGIAVRLAESRLNSYTPPQPTSYEKPITVIFHSGLTQPADEVTEDGPYYYIRFSHRTYPVRKDLVKDIVRKG